MKNITIPELHIQGNYHQKFRKQVIKFGEFNRYYEYSHHFLLHQICPLGMF